MNRLTKVIILILIFTLSSVASAGDLTKKSLSKTNLKQIKFTSSDVDNINMFLTDSDEVIYRISSLKETEAQNILNHFKKNAPLIINAVQGQYKAYFDVESWE